MIRGAITDDTVREGGRIKQSYVNVSKTEISTQLIKRSSLVDKDYFSCAFTVASAPRDEWAVLVYCFGRWVLLSLLGYLTYTAGPNDCY